MDSYQGDLFTKRVQAGLQKEILHQQLSKFSSLSLFIILTPGSRYFHCYGNHWVCASIQWLWGWDYFIVFFGLIVYLSHSVYHSICVAVTRLQDVHTYTKTSCLKVACQVLQFLIIFMARGRDYFKSAITHKVKGHKPILLIDINFCDLGFVNKHTPQKLVIPLQYTFRRSKSYSRWH